MAVAGSGRLALGGGGQRSFAAEYGGPEARSMLLERLAYGAYVARGTGLPNLVSGLEKIGRIVRAFGLASRVRGEW